MSKSLFYSKTVLPGFRQVQATILTVLVMLWILISLSIAFAAISNSRKTLQAVENGST